jgi:hypothetical protein
MIWETEMIWTAICEKNGKTSVVVFHCGQDPDAALKNILGVVRCDGLSVLALVKGDHAGAFYGMDTNLGELHKEGSTPD